MNIEVVLTEDDPKLGKRGELVKVSSGFAQNFLYPHKKALPATPANLKGFEAARARDAKLKAETLSEAKALAAKLGAMSLTLEVQTGPEDKMYGSVSAQTLHEALAAQGITVEKKHVHLAEPIRALGAYQVDVKPHADVTAKLKVWVIKKK